MWTIKMDVKKLYKWMWKNYKNGFDKTIQMDLTKLYKWKWQNYTNEWDKTIQMDREQLDMAKLYKWMLQVSHLFYSFVTSIWIDM